MFNVFQKKQIRNKHPANFKLPSSPVQRIQCPNRVYTHMQMKIILGERIVDTKTNRNKSQSDIGILSHLKFTFQSPELTLNEKYANKHIKSVYSFEN